MTTTPEEPEYVKEPWGTYLFHTAKDVFKLLCWFVAIIVVAVLGGYGYEQLDVSGDISHDQTTDVYMSNDWLVGENRVCSLTEYPDAKGKPTGKVLGLLCPMEDKKLEPHNLSVTFKGVLDPKGMDGEERPIAAEWTCTRGSDSFVCHPK
jgi:hypothetical protein